MSTTGGGGPWKPRGRRPGARLIAEQCRVHAQFLRENPDAMAQALAELVSEVLAGGDVDVLRLELPTDLLRGKFDQLLDQRR